MFKSIRWRFVLIYFLLVFLTMAVVGIFVVTQLERTQLDINFKNTRIRISSIYESSSAMQNDNWHESGENIKSNVQNSIQLGYDENLYVILNDDEKTIIASSIDEVSDYSAYNVDRISNETLVKSVESTVAVTQIVNDSDNTPVSHTSYPIKSESGMIKGFIYLTNDVSFITETVDQSRNILTQATLIALFLTVILGLTLSKSITGPIKDLTIKAKLMSQGDFDQKVEIKSNDEIGQLGRMFNYLIDELKMSISRLYEEKNKMETTFTYMADGVLTIDRTGEIIHINPVAKAILNVKNNDMYYDQIISRKTHDLYLETIEKNSWKGNYTLETEEATYTVEYMPFSDLQNQISGAILLFKDITEQFKTERLQKEFVANVSHELKTPITTIKSYTETLLEGAIEDKETSLTFLNVINSESERMARLVSDLLKLSRMDHSKDGWTKEKLSINSVVEDVYTKLILQAKTKKINLMCEYDIKNSYVLFDKDGLEQILLNIISNSIKYTSDEGSVAISISAGASKVVVSIKDTGVGIPKEDLTRVFERFYRVDKARTRQMGGTGLGLSIANEIALEHDSKILIESEELKGTSVEIIIPKYVSED